jgi:hypothetical protein
MHPLPNLAHAFRRAVVITAALASFACASNAKLHVTKALPDQLAGYDTVNITATGTPAKVARAARKFEELLATRLKDANVFGDVTSDGELVVACKVTHMDFGDEDTRQLTLRGKAVVTVEIRITKPDGTLLGHVTVTASARKKNADDQVALRVLQVAADEVTDYLSSHVKHAAPAPAKDKAKPKAEEPVGISAEEATSGGDDSSEEDAEGEEE